MTALNNANKHSADKQNAIELEIAPLQLILGNASKSSNTGQNLVQAELWVQALVIRFSRPQSLISPGDLAGTVLPAELDWTQPVVLFGQAPAWLVGRLISQLTAAALPAQTGEPEGQIPWLGCYDARGQQVVVVVSNVASVAVGDALGAVLNLQRCPAILVGGPPDSGKSVFSNALRVAIKQRYPNKRVYLHRASWDGEGNWTYEAGTADEAKPELIKKLVTLNEFRIHEKAETAKLIPGYFVYHARAVDNLRQITDCLIVDVGGMPQPEKQPLVERCSHYVVVSKDAAAVADWHGLCGGALQPLAVVHSVLTAQQIVSQENPLEMIAGPWVNAQTAVMPEEILKRIDEILEEE